MPPKKKKDGASGGEKQVQKSPAEFFAENQSIAGFDNLGKSLYTSIRELVENSLDACESIGVLPNISVYVTEYTQKEFNQLSGIGDSPRKNQKDTELFQTKKRKSSKGSGTTTASQSTSPTDDTNDSGKKPETDKTDESNDGSSNPKQNAKQQRRGAQEAYFLLSVRDNGCGMAHDAIPDLFGRVLSGSKYGVRQTRGKFGLGAKMCLIWAKKSSSHPIRIKTAHRPTGAQQEEVPTHVSSCVLDIDIYKNTPRIIEHKKMPNKENWVGTQVQVLIAGNWTTYKSRIVQYLQQLAIITPYAALEMNYENASDPKRSMNICYDRRSEQMPPPAKLVKHHPSSVNNLTLQSLIQYTHCKTLSKLLTKELSSVSPAIAKRLITELGSGFDESMALSELTDKHITRLVQLLRQVNIFKAPDALALSPLGEYNLNLGIQKVLEPDLIATARDKPGAFEGHPFVVEAAVSLGGKNVKEGISVLRFANRIPLLFEGGADVSTRVAQTKIKWSSYKIDHKKDKVGVFVSIVSTKIPFKGTSKEYIGDDATEIQLSVKRALQSCCQQLRARLTKRNALKDAKERKNRLTKYVPDIGRSLYGILDAMRKRRAGDDGPSPTSLLPLNSPTKRRRLNHEEARSMIQLLNRGEVTEERIRQSLTEAIDDQLAKDDLLFDDSAGGKQNGGQTEVGVPVFLVPLYNLDDSQYDVRSSLFTFRPIQPLSFKSNGAP